MTAYDTAPNTAVIVFHVFADEKPVHLDRSARLELGNLANHLGKPVTWWGITRNGVQQFPGAVFAQKLSEADLHSFALLLESEKQH